MAGAMQDAESEGLPPQTDWERLQPAADSGSSAAAAATADSSIATDNIPVLLGPVMQGLDSLQSVTGLPWWAVISLSAIGRA